VPAQTSKTPGDGSGTLSYTLASDSFDVESVYVSVDATTATGPVTAELTVRDQSGVVIARKKQAATIPAGQAGSATWSLRLDDEGAESAYTTIQEEGVPLPQEKILDFVGAGVTAADDPANARTTVTIPGGGGGGGGGLPWALATEAGYIAADWYLARSPDPLGFALFTATPSAPFAFVTTNNPTTGDGDVTITSEGLYLVRLVISSGLRAAGTDPGYPWDMTVYANGQDAGGTNYFGPDLFPFGQVVQPVSSYAFYLHPRDNFGAPNGNSMRGRMEQHVATESILNLPDSVVTWPVTISARAFHGLNDADVTRPPQYNLWLMRLGDSNPAAPTT
jgi:hypothetical protein